MRDIEENCIFCKLLNNNEDKTFIADFTYGRLFVNFSQTYYGRCMYVFKDHIQDITQANNEYNLEFMREIFIISKVLKELLNFDRIDVATLGNEVSHYHWHLIPRYKTDSNYEQESPWPHVKTAASRDYLKKLSLEIYEALIEYQDEKYIIDEVSPSKKILKLNKKISGA